MKVLNFGSLNIDHVYRVPHIAQPGETLPGESYALLAGGKGANQSAALACAGAPVWHVGKVGPEGGWLIEKLATLGANTEMIQVGDTPTGHAIIQVDEAGQNAIVLFAGANHAFERADIDAAVGKNLRLARLGAADAACSGCYLSMRNFEHSMRLDMGP